MCRSRREKKPLSAKGSFRRAGLVVLIGLGATLFVNRLTQQNRPVPPPEPRRLDRLSASTLAEHISLTSAAEAARAAEEELDQLTPIVESPSLPPARPGVVAVIEVPTEGPHPGPEKAKAAAAEVAARLLTKQLAELESPIDTTVTTGDVLGRYFQRATVKPVPADDQVALVEATGDRAEWSTATVTAEISPEQLRKLRAATRTLEGIKVSAALAACLAALLAFLSLDSLTKGYLSWGLALGLGGAAIGSVVGLFYLL